MGVKKIKDMDCEKKKKNIYIYIYIYKSGRNIFANLEFNCHVLISSVLLNDLY